MITKSTITCPACGTAKTETMPTDACQYFYECTGCGTLLRLLYLLFLWLGQLPADPGIE